MRRAAASRASRTRSLRLRRHRVHSVTEPGAELGHIHGLGVNAGTLYIATHYGLWTAPEGQTRAERFGESTQDVMGFSVVGRDRFIGSGHPDPSQQMPPNLGLIESSDGGENWKSRSLLGRADFHVLESAGRRVYGFDGTQGRLMVSSDGGGSWDQRTPPAGVFSLAISPDDPDRVVASSPTAAICTQRLATDPSSVLRTAGGPGPCGPLRDRTPGDGCRVTASALVGHQRT